MKTTFYWRNPHYNAASTVGGSLNQTQPSWSARLSNFWHGWLASLDVSTEPRVWSTRNSQKEITWNAYDPMTGHGIYQVTDYDLRVWLEDLHYQDQALANCQQEWLKACWSR